MKTLKDLGFLKLATNSVSRIRKQAKNEFHIVLITDEVNLTTTFHKYSWLTLLILDNVSSINLKVLVESFMKNLKKTIKNKKIIIIYSCGLCFFLERFKALNFPSTSEDDNQCCKECDFYFYNEKAEAAEFDVIEVDSLISSILPLSYFVPLTLPPYDIKWNIEQNLFLHQECCSHLLLNSTDERLLPLLDSMQEKFDENLRTYNDGILKLLKKNDLPVVRWDEVAQVKSSISEHQLLFSNKINAVPSIIIRNYCFKQMKQLQESINGSSMTIKEELDEVSSSHLDNTSISDGLNLSDYTNESNEVTLENQTCSENHSLDNENNKLGEVKLLNGGEKPPTSSKFEKTTDGNKINSGTSCSEVLEMDVELEPSDSEIDIVKPNEESTNSRIEGHNPDEVIPSSFVPESEDSCSSISCTNEVFSETLDFVSPVKKSVNKTEDVIIIINGKRNETINIDDSCGEDLKRASSVQSIIELEDSPVKPLTTVKSEEPNLFISLNEEDIKPEPSDANWNDSEKLLDEGISLFKRIQEEGNSLSVIVTDDRFEGITAVLDRREELVNVIHVWGEKVLIPQMSYSIFKSIGDALTLRINRNKTLFVTLCLGTVDIIELLSKRDLNNTYFQQGVNLVDDEITDIVFNRLLKVKGDILNKYPATIVAILKIPEINNKPFENKIIKRLNHKLHDENRQNDFLRKFSDADVSNPELKYVGCSNFQLTFSECVHQINLCMSLSSSYEKIKCDEKNKGESKKNSAIKDIEVYKCKEVVDISETSFPKGKSTKRANCASTTKAQLDDRSNVSSAKKIKLYSRTPHFINLHKNIICKTSEESSASNFPGDADIEMIDEITSHSTESILKELNSTLSDKSLVRKVNEFIDLLNDDADIIPEYEDFTLIDKLSVLLSINIISDKNLIEPLISILKKCASNSDTHWQKREELSILEAVGVGHEYLENSELHPHIHQLMEKVLSSLSSR